MKKPKKKKCNYKTNDKCKKNKSCGNCKSVLDYFGIENKQQK